MQKFQLSSIVIGLVVGSVVGAVAELLEFPRWLFELTVVVLFVVMVVWATAVYFKKTFAKPTGTVTCARCGFAPRTESGWCGPCTARLSAATAVPMDHPLRGYLAENTARDLRAMARRIAPKHVTVLPDGRAISRSPDRWRRVVSTQQRYMKVIEGRLLGMYADPDDRSITWLRTYDRYRLFGFQALDINAVTRHRIDVHGLIDESRVYPGL